MHGRAAGGAISENSNDSAFVSTGGNVTVEKVKPQTESKDNGRRDWYKEHEGEVIGFPQENISNTFEYSVLNHS